MKDAIPAAQQIGALQQAVKTLMEKEKALAAKEQQIKRLCEILDVLRIGATEEDITIIDLALKEVRG